MASTLLLARGRASAAVRCLAPRRLLSSAELPPPPAPPARRRRAASAAAPPSPAPASPPAPSAAAGGRVSFIGAPFAQGQRLAGVDLGPRALRELADLPRGAESLGWRWRDAGDVDVGDAGAAAAGAAAASAAAAGGGIARNSAAVGAANAAVHAACAAAARAGDFVLLCGGDHSVAAGSVSAALGTRPDLGVIWVDAHADINTPSSSPSGNMHGMPVSILMQDAAASGATRGGEWDFLRAAPRLEPGALVYVGLRDLDPEEARLVRALGVLAFSMADVDARGIGRIMAAAVRHLRGRPLHLSFDVDAVDPGVVAATGTAVPGGLSYREAHYVCEAAAASGRLCSMDLVEVNPVIGGAPAPPGAAPFSQAGVATTAAAASFVLSALGKVTLPLAAKAAPRAPRAPKAAPAPATSPATAPTLAL